MKRVTAVYNYYMYIILVLLTAAFATAYLLSPSFEAKRLIFIFGMIQAVVYCLFMLLINKANKEFRRMNRIQQRMIDNAYEAVAIYEVVRDDQKEAIADYRFLLVNQTFSEMTGLTADQVLGKTITEVLPQTEAFWLETYSNVVTKQDRISFVNYSAALDKYLQVTAIPVSEGKFATLFLDITDKLNMERALKVASKNEKKASAFKSQFMRDVNHKLRTPLNAMMGLIQLIHMESLEPATKELFDLMLIEMKNSRNILNQIAEYIDMKDETYQITENDMFADVDQVSKEVIGADVDVECDLEHEELTRIFYERKVFQKVLGTLLNNAERHSGSKQVAVLIEKDRVNYGLTDYFKVSVKDYGKGIETERQEIIFNEMHHEDFVNIYREEGHMSLPLCKALMNHIGGDLTCTSNPYEGAVFSIRLPYFNKVGREQSY